MHERIDITFDFQTDCPGKDPDSYSPKLRSYHKLLWSKPLPSGVVFELVETTPDVYLHHLSEIGEFFLASDAVIPTFRKESRMESILKELAPGELKAFIAIGYTIGGIMIFPGNRIDGKMTINGARGFHPRIKDRFDLTVECIRRHYCNEVSPLSEVLQRYANFFDLFGDFRGYVEFFLLQDLVNEDCSSVNFFSPFEDEDFEPWPLPDSLEAYRIHKRNAVEFIQARNRRMLASF